MDIHTLTRELQEPSDSKIVLLVADGLGGLPIVPGGKTERPDPNPHRIADDVRAAIAEGWKPKSRGRPFTLVCD